MMKEFTISLARKEIDWIIKVIDELKEGNTDCDKLKDYDINNWDPSIVVDDEISLSEFNIMKSIYKKLRE